MKIKQKKQVNLLEFINWAWENGIKNKFYPLNNSTGKIGFDHDGDLMVITEEDFDEVYVKKSETFEIEEEVEIDENTVLDKVIELFTYAGVRENLYMHRSSSISKIIKEPKEHIKTTHIYYFHPDGTMTLIWKNGNMMEEDIK